jgi:formylglycine-generating enzyme required for sulfatase activity
MKYEMSQAQYRDFLNTLTSSQASNRFLNAFGGNRHGITTTGGDPPYGCNLDGDDIFDEANDGEWIACNYISWEDGSAYADWAALRPMTEFEYEKACRGNQGVVDDEYAWGTTSYTIASGLINPGTENETVSNSGEGLVNCESSYPDGPFRCGFAATASTNRAGAGAGYWGIMELSGNLSEWVVSVQDSEGRSFTGVHGDGELSASGYANVENWPDRVGSNGRGYGRRGGYWSVGIGVSPHFFCVAGRPYGVWDVEASLRDRNVTIRCVRTAP